jgi:hypothetical protein
LDDAELVGQDLIHRFDRELDVVFHKGIDFHVIVNVIDQGLNGFVVFELLNRSVKRCFISFEALEHFHLICTSNLL